MEIVASIFTDITSDRSTVEAVESDYTPHDASLNAVYHRSIGRMAASHMTTGHMTTDHMTTYDTDSDDTEYICDDDSSSSCSSLSR